MEVALRLREDGVLISVEDDDPTPAEAIVSILARSWRVEKLEGGKRIWVELAEAAHE